MITKTNDPIILGRIIPDSGKIHQNQEVLSIYGGGMTLKSSHYKDPPKILVLGNIYPSNGQNGNVYSTKGISPTISSGETSTRGNGGIGSSNAPKTLVEETKNEIEVLCDLGVGGATR